MIKENILSIGDRVASTAKGYYKGISGTVLSEADYNIINHPNVIKDYVIELDTGEVITLGTDILERVIEEEIEEENIVEEENNGLEL